MTQRRQPTRKGRSTPPPPIEMTEVEEKLVALVEAQVPPEFLAIPEALRATIDVLWRCSCGELFAGPDLEHTVHIHAAYSPGTHRVVGPVYRDADAMERVKAQWATEDSKETV